MVAQNLWKWPVNVWFNLRHMLYTAWMTRNWRLDSPETYGLWLNGWSKKKNEKKPMTWFLMILCYIHRLLSCSVVTREASCRSRWKQVQRSTARHYAEGEYKLKVSTESLPSELGEARRRRGGKILRVRVDRRHQENMAHWINEANLIWPHRDWRDKHRACKGLYKVLNVYVSAVSFAFL